MASMSFNLKLSQRHYRAIDCISQAIKEAKLLYTILTTILYYPVCFTYLTAALSCQN